MNQAKNLKSGDEVVYKGQLWKVAEVNKLKPFQIGQDGYPRLNIILTREGQTTIKVPTYGTTVFITDPAALQHGWIEESVKVVVVKTTFSVPQRRAVTVHAKSLPQSAPAPESRSEAPAEPHHEEPHHEEPAEPTDGQHLVVVEQAWDLESLNDHGNRFEDDGPTAHHHLPVNETWDLESLNDHNERYED
eukprot:c6099_g1_i1.p1 GENE.c6099_g1_i1~~c6099_g1_i1.p1  ORF type:complete len:190 (+),score=25.96 c6099_g1_i1:56-625(+)